MYATADTGITMHERLCTVILQLVWVFVFEGKALENWPSTKGQVIVKMMDTPVDLLEDVPIEVTEKQRRRWLPRGLSGGRDKMTIT